MVLTSLQIFQAQIISKKTIQSSEVKVGSSSTGGTATTVFALELPMVTRPDIHCQVQVRTTMTCMVWAMNMLPTRGQDMALAPGGMMLHHCRAIATEVVAV
jgi:hypothetical protein